MNNTAEMFLSCDWGTSSFRLRLVSAATQEVIAEETSDAGIATVFSLWQQQSKADRVSFYLRFLQQTIVSLEQKLNHSLQQVPLIISGMASSTIGMMEIAYKESPFLLDGSDLKIEMLNATPSFPHDIYLISGVKTNDDVMRGEETQLIGSLQNKDLQVTEQIVILPGTHSKHVFVKGNQAVSFQTYMTGEFFDLLSQKSVLSFSVEKGSGFNDEENQKSFGEGVTDSKKHNLLHGSFLVRTAQLFGKFSKQQNFYYLSGLLIGTELREVTDKAGIPITLVGNGSLLSLYREAFRCLLPGKIINVVDGTDAVVRGHSQIFRRLK